MRSITVSLKMLLWQLRTDKMGAVIMGFPLAAALLFRFAAPYVDSRIAFDLSAYYPLLDLMTIYFALTLPGFSAAMVMLEELDSKVVPSLCSSPLGKNGYLMSRFVPPGIFGLLLSAVLISTLNLGALPFSIYTAVIVCGILCSYIPNLIVVAYARNKVEGVAIFKMGIMTMTGLLIPFFIDSWVQYLFGFLPSYWMALVITRGEIIYAVPSLFLSAVWLWFPLRRYLNKIT